MQLLQAISSLYNSGIFIRFLQIIFVYIKFRQAFFQNKLEQQYMYAIVCMQGVSKYIVYLGWPIAPSYMSPNAGGREVVAGSQPMSTSVHRSPKKLWRCNSILNLCLCGLCIEYFLRLSTAVSLIFIEGLKRRLVCGVDPLGVDYVVRQLLTRQKAPYSAWDS